MSLRSISLLALTPALLAACTIERSVPLDRFACTNGGPCPVDAGPLPDADTPIPDSGDVPDAGFFPDADVPDVGPPDTGVPDAGLPVPSCFTALPMPASGYATGDTTQERNDHQPSCNDGIGGRDVAFWFTTEGRIERLVLTSVGSDFDSVLYVYDGECQRAAEIACDDDGATTSFAARIELFDVAPGAYYVVLDGWDNVALGGYVLDVQGRVAIGERCDPATPFLGCGRGTCAPDGTGVHRCRLPLDCGDGVDNDGDGTADEDTAACRDAPVVTCPASSIVAVGDTLRLEATATDDEPLGERRWSLVSSPSAVYPTPFETVEGTGTATLTVALAGEYVLRHQVIDADTQAVACETRVTASPGADVRVEMFWIPPIGTDEAHLDLHVLEPSAAAWFDAALDCAPGNCTGGLPWGEPGSPADPRHLGDVTRGQGPEVVVLDTPTAGATYRVGVFYADDAFFGPSEAFVQIHCGGTLAASYGPVTLVLGDPDDLDGQNTFWKVADVAIDSAGCTATALSDPGGGPLLVTSTEARAAR
ncbi:hypothetical protein L6R52_39360 [Myxococcota bacterium]|nr:hypothetical protein [Myxococcota bacterium]